jgi:hypothetical protein
MKWTHAHGDVFLEHGPGAAYKRPRLPWGCRRRGGAARGGTRTGALLEGRRQRGAVDRAQDAHVHGPVHAPSARWDSASGLVEEKRAGDRDGRVSCADLARTHATRVASRVATG